MTTDYPQLDVHNSGVASAVLANDTESPVIGTNWIVNQFALFMTNKIHSQSFLLDWGGSQCVSEGV